jgi:5-methylcytosine-specific restriction endonuclease McrA
MKKPTPVKAFIIATLRRASYRWRGRSEAVKLARRDRGLYECASCKNLFRNKEYCVDHISPIVPVTGFDSWDGFIERLFCEADGFQILCYPCHDLKSSNENIVRKIKRKSSKITTK